MTLKCDEYYECYAEKAEFHEGKSGGLFIKMLYRFPKTGDTLPYYHQLVNAEGKIRTFPVDRKDPNGPKTTEQAILEKRYGVDLSNFEFDQNALKPEILVRALVVEEVGEWQGKPYKRPRIRFIFDNTPRDSGDRPAPNKDDLRRRFGSALRAGHVAAPRPAPAVAKPNAAPAAPAKAPAPVPAPAAAAAIGAEPTVESSLNECWNNFCANPDVAAMPQDDRTRLWFETLSKAVGHSRQESMTPAEWGTVLEHIKAAEGAEEKDTDDIPF